MKVKVDGAPAANAPTPVNKAVIDGQGSIPYASSKAETLLSVVIRLL